MARPKLTRSLAWAAALDAANANARKQGRKTWNEDDRDVMARTFDDLWPVEFDLAGYETVPLRHQ